MNLVSFRRFLIADYIIVLSVLFSFSRDLVVAISGISFLS